MESTELRIGNWVSIHGANQKVTCLNVPFAVLTRTNGLDGSMPGVYKEIYGIPLTEEILLKCGFIANSYGGYCKSWKPSKYNDSLVEYRVGRGMNDAGQWSLWDASQNGHPEIKNGIRYVHELQNIWYILTRSEELTVNL